MVGCGKGGTGNGRSGGFVLLDLVVSVCPFHAVIIEIDGIQPYCCDNHNRLAGW